MVKNIILRFLRLMLGFVLVILGILGLVLPGLQGLLFLGLGLALLAPDIPPLARLICLLERRFPKLRKAAEHLFKRHRD